MRYSSDYLLKWLEDHQGYALVSDDNGHWACVTDGMQNVPDGDEPQEIWTTFMIEAHEWFGSVWQAIQDAVEKERGE